MGAQGSIVNIVTHNGLEYPRIISWCFYDVQTNPKAHPDCCTMGSGSVLGEVKRPEWVLTTHLLLVPGCEWVAALRCDPFATWHLRFVPALACHEVTFTFSSLYLRLYFVLIFLLCLVRMHLCCCFFPYEMCSDRMCFWCFLCYSLSLFTFSILIFFYVTWR